MNDHSNFLSQGYRIVEELTHNRQGGRITYKAIEINTNTPVVIKQFRFASAQNSWSEFKEIEREIDVLRGLNHPGIPKYLNKIDPGDGLCLLQEYKNADPLSKLRSFSPEDIKSITTQILEILVYLQERIPAIIHRDLKPENILVDEEINVYVIDFGLARVGNNTMAFSTMQGGTLGFMPPEQIHNHKLTEASDLYGLGATIICLITQTKSQDIGNLVDFSSNRINFKDKASKYSFRFIQWLEKMVEPDPKKRFANAKLALEAFQPLYVVRVPEFKVNPNSVQLEAQQLGEKLEFTINISNSVPETILQGGVAVVDHPGDRPLLPEQSTSKHDAFNHSWITIDQTKFEGNNIQCQVILDTGNLRAEKLYERQLKLTSNATDKPYIIPIKLQTAPIPIEKKSIPYLWLSMLLAVSLLLPFQLTFMQEVWWRVTDGIESIWE